MGRLNRLTRLFHALRRSFWLLPVSGCVLALVLAVLAHLADRAGWPGQAIAPAILDIDEDGARALLSAVVGATATIMSLTYTLTLLIFTLAAGSLGPRLLDSFYDNRTNQITIAMLGSTFVFALVSLYLMSGDHEARVAALAALLLSVGSILTLVLFVHDVAQRVLVDNEAGLTGKRLKRAIDLAFRDPDCEPEPDAVLPERDGDAVRVVETGETGYLRSIDLDELVRDMEKHDALVELLVAPGEYLIERMPVALVRRTGEVEDWRKAVDARLVCGKSRSSEGDILFSVNLLVEIALRALSPGVNDSFTAISAIDNLTGAFGEMLHRETRSPVHVDRDGTARVIATVLEVEDILGAAFDPIRRSAAGNMLVSCAMLDAVQRLIAVSDPRYVPALRRHAALIGETALPERATEADRRALSARLTPLTREAA